jgi:hypothetical protein
MTVDHSCFVDRERCKPGLEQGSKEAGRVYWESTEINMRYRSPTVGGNKGLMGWVDDVMEPRGKVTAVLMSVIVVESTSLQALQIGSRVAQRKKK